MWNFLKIFKQKKKTDSVESATKDCNMDKCYDLIVISRDEQGFFNKQREENGVVASSVQELEALYKQCDEKIQIKRVYDVAPTNEQLPTLEEINRIPGNNVHLLPMPNIPGANVPQQNTIEVSPQLNPNSVPISSTTIPAQYQVQQQTIPMSIPPAPMPKEEPQYFRIGGIDCKIENGHVFQKQWVKLFGADAANYRLVSEKTNKIIPFTGKILEVLKWIQLEDQSSETVNQIRAITNGQN